MIFVFDKLNLQSGNNWSDFHIADRFKGNGHIESVWISGKSEFLQVRDGQKIRRLGFIQNTRSLDEARGDAEAIDDCRMVDPVDAFP